MSPISTLTCNGIATYLKTTHWNIGTIVKVDDKSKHISHSIFISMIISLSIFISMIISHSNTIYRV